MKDKILMNIIKSMFDMEISNSYVFDNNSLYIILKDGSVAKISAKKIGLY